MSVANGWEWAAVFTTGRCKTGSSIACSRMGYAHDCQQVDSLPSEEWDIPLPAVITPGKNTTVLVGTRGREIQPGKY